MERALASRGVGVMTFTAAVAAALLMMPPFGAALATGDSRCTTVCGNISIPYPFGVEPGCHLDGFNLTCNQSYHPPKLFLGDGTVQVLDISIPNGTVHINSSRIDLSDPPEPPLTANSTWVAGGALGGGGPYFLSERRNKLVAVGCDVQVFLLGEDSDPVSTCAAFCTQVSKGLYMVGSPDCSGVGCCQATIPAGHASYLLQLRRFNGSWSGTSANVFIVDSEFFSPYPEAAIEFGMATALPAVLDWSINSSLCHSNLSSPECCSSHSFCQNSTAFGHDRGHRCHCSPGYQGNPYVTNGCNDINECDFPEIYPCFGDCNNTQRGYQCQCPPGFNGDASIPKGCKDIDECAHPEAHSCFGICINMPGTFHCRCHHGTYGDPYVKGGCMTIKNSFTGLSIALVVSGGSIFVLLALVAPFITRKIKLRRVKKLKEKYFKQNHGLLLQQLISRKADIGERMIITLRGLEKATDNFDKTREVGGGGHGVVYKGILDLHVVAIKKSKIVVQREIDEFINEVAILSQINHRNVVKLLGCCLETEVPLLVYEFISNGTLYRHLHVEAPISLSWDDRLRIALEVARALSYLHSAASMPIFHRDIKSSNILLDDSLTAKVSDFGASRYIPIDQSGVTTAIQGTIGYLDPTYYYTGRLTDKSDVFSFGILVIELLTRKKPFLYRSNNGDSLISHFGSLLTEGKLADIIDPQVMEEENGDVQEVAVLAVTCTKLNGEDRPTMREVEMTLENIRVTNKRAPHTTAPRNRDTIPVEGATQEASRQYSMEEEFLLSSRYPR